ncbi:hypothetical protein [Rodentibacter caecimuris]|uniref:hypothetical protein n=1 Tax=Rodentibacter caecimuris TaxID=1796644 RepID=UPI0007517279|nr:hypothetical protein [Rodentibacter heylii]AOF53364.1 hypothetical protein AC062_1271 [Pasteurellaceae bacterium NI1060]MCQ9124043.1 hypothetical protein [Rodentibacter heylii]
MKNNNYLFIQKKILQNWIEDQSLSSLINNSEEIILFPETIYIYQKYRNVSEFHRIYGSFNIVESLRICMDIFNSEDYVYILCNLIVKNIDNYSISDKYFPIFKINTTQLFDWFNLAFKKEYVSLYIFSINNDNFLEISLMDDEYGTKHYHFTTNKIGLIR